LKSYATDAAGNGHLLVVECPQKRLPHFGNQALYPSSIGPIDKNNELIPAKTRYHVGAADGLPQGVRDASKNSVALRVSTVVIESFKIVEIDVCQRDRLRIACFMGPNFLKPLARLVSAKTVHSPRACRAPARADLLGSPAGTRHRAHSAATSNVSQDQSCSLSSMSGIFAPLLRKLNHARVIGRLQKKVILYQTTSEAESLPTNSATVGHLASRKVDLLPDCGRSSNACQEVDSLNGITLHIDTTSELHARKVPGAVCGPGRGSHARFMESTDRCRGEVPRARTDC
jgi:hypothetical protein